MKTHCCSSAAGRLRSPLGVCPEGFFFHVYFSPSEVDPLSLAGLNLPFRLMDV